MIEPGQSDRHAHPPVMADASRGPARDHGHGHAAHDHGISAARPDAADHLGRLRTVLGLVVVFLVVQVVVGLVAGSLAVLSDAGHMATDALGIAMSLAAITAALRSARSDRLSGRTFGWYRLEILAALANSVLLIGVGVYVLFEAIRRLRADEATEVTSWPVIVIGVVGLAVNIVSMLLLRKGAADNLNIRGAYLEVVADALGSVAVIVSGALTALFDWVWIDPVIGAAIGLFILPRAWMLGREALRVLVQAAPDHLDPAVVSDRLGRVEGVVGVHDLHIWTLTSQMDVVTAHLSIDPEADHGLVLDASRRVLAETFGLDHATLQVERTAGADDDCGHPDW